jgi:hypothetical protein
MTSTADEIAIEAGFWTRKAHEDSLQEKRLRDDRPINVRWWTYRLHNNRVRVGIGSDGTTCIHLKTLLGWRNVRHTKFKISPEGAKALTEGLLMVARIQEQERTQALQRHN